MGEKMVGAGAEVGRQRFKPKKGISGVIPPKKRSVKKMMLDSMVKSIATVLHKAKHMIKIFPHRVQPLSAKSATLMSTIT